MCKIKLNGITKGGFLEKKITIEQMQIVEIKLNYNV